jgi:hypothetical protein
VHGVAAPPVEDLVLELRDPHIQTAEGKRRGACSHFPVKMWNEGRA